jgi:hypothetical protein
MDSALKRELRSLTRTIRFITLSVITFIEVKRKIVCLLRNQWRTMLFVILATAWLSYFTNMDMITAVPYFIHAELDLRKAYADLFVTTHAEAFTYGALSLATRTVVLRLLAQARSLRRRKLLRVIKEDAKHVKAPNPLLITTVFGPITLTCY